MEQYCTRCGKKLKDGAFFCSTCGAPVHMHADHAQASGTEWGGTAQTLAKGSLGFAKTLGSVLMSLMCGVFGLAGTASLANAGYLLYAWCSKEAAVYPWWDIELSGTALLPAGLVSMVAAVILFLMAKGLSKGVRDLQQV